MPRPSLVNSRGQSAVRGFVQVQNVHEHAAAAGAGGTIANTAASEILAHRNIVQVHNTIPGTGASGSNPSRWNQIYSESAAGAGQPRKELASRFNLFYDLNSKGDTYTVTSTATGRVTNWPVRFGVGFAGNVVILSDDNGSAVLGPTNWIGDYWEPGSAVGAAVGFADNKSGGAASLGGGDYALTGESNDAYARVPAGLSMLRYDLAGALRRTNGTGAAGAYEWAG